MAVSAQKNASSVLSKLGDGVFADKRSTPKPDEKATILIVSDRKNIVRDSLFPKLLACDLANALRGPCNEVRGGRGDLLKSLEKSAMAKI